VSSFLHLNIHRHPGEGRDIEDMPQVWFFSAVMDCCVERFSRPATNCLRRLGWVPAFAGMTNVGVLGVAKKAAGFISIGLGDTCGLRTRQFATGLARCKVFGQ
jgi:hypothetical protein